MFFFGASVSKWKRYFPDSLSQEFSGWTKTENRFKKLIVLSFVRSFVPLFLAKSCHQSKAPRVDASFGFDLTGLCGQKEEKRRFGCKVEQELQQPGFITVVFGMILILIFMIAPWLMLCLKCWRHRRGFHVHGWIYSPNAENDGLLTPITLMEKNWNLFFNIVFLSGLTDIFFYYH